MKRILFLLLCVLSSHCASAQNVVTNDSIVHLQKRSEVKYHAANYERSRFDGEYLLQRAGEMQRRSANLRIMSLACAGVGGIVSIAANNKTGHVIGICFGVVGLACEVTSIIYQHKSGVSLEASGSKVMLKF